MGKAAGQASGIWVSGYDISGSLNKASPGMGRDLTDVSCFQDDGKKWRPHFQRDSLAVSGFFESGADLIDEILGTLQFTEVNVAALIGGTAFGSVAYGATLFLNDYKLTSPTDGAVVLDAMFQPGGASDGILDQGIILLPKGTIPRTADSEGSGHDGLAATVSGAVAYLHVFECGADDDLVVTIEDDDNDGFTSANTLITFTAATGITSEKKTVAGAVQRHVRVAWNGVEPWSANFAVIFRRIADPIV